MKKDNDLHNVVDHAIAFRQDYINKLSASNSHDKTSQAIIFFKLNRDVLIHQNYQYKYDVMRYNIVVSLLYHYPGADAKTLYWVLTKSRILSNKALSLIYAITGTIFVQCILQTDPGFLLVVQLIYIGLLYGALSYIIHDIYNVKFLCKPKIL